MAGAIVFKDLSNEDPWDRRCLETNVAAALLSPGSDLCATREAHGEILDEENGWLDALSEAIDLQGDSMVLDQLRTCSEKKSNAWSVISKRNVLLSSAGVEMALTSECVSVVEGAELIAWFRCR